MKLHPMLVLALTETGDPEAVEKACKGDWDRVARSSGGGTLVVFRKDHTVKATFPLVADDAPLRPTCTCADAPYGCPLHLLDSEIGPLCPCGCGERVVNHRVGRQRLYASEACRKRVNGARWRAERAARAAGATPAPEVPDVAPTTPVPVEDVPEAPVPEVPPAPPAPEPPVPAQARRKSGFATTKVQEPPGVVVCGRCLEKGHSVFTCTKEPEQRLVVVQPLSGEGVSDNDLTAHNQRLRDLCKAGLPDRFQYSYLPDVLALYGIDQDLLDSCLRLPERVEVRPESFDKEKRYCVLAFYKGDLEVILGMRNPSAPKVIAAYATSRLEHDTHRVGHTGGGGAKGRSTGLPKTSKQVATRLRAMGAEVEVDIRQKTCEVIYKEQSLGQIATDGDRQTAESDYQRIQRKMAAIDRRVSA